MAAPPSYIYDSHVVEYAEVDDSVVFEQRRWINVNGEWLGKVPCIAICQDFKSLEYVIELCTSGWEPLARVPGYDLIEKAKARLERSYHGVSAKWIRAEMTFEEARALRRLDLREDSCSFCGRTPLEMNRMVATEDHFVRICDRCIDRHYEMIHRDDKPNGASSS
jgi:ClpX C4-type zinc finger